MLASLMRPVRRGVQALLADDTPRQLAAGFAVGMVIGLMPKGNLIAVSLCVLLFSIRVNTGMGLVAAVLFSLNSTWVDPFADKLGMEVLSIAPLQATYAGVMNLPLGPWLGFNNTVVVGSLLVGLYLMYPTYWACLLACRYGQPRAAAWIERRRSESQVHLFTIDDSDHRRAA